jgi:sulfur carrier protein ThiS
LKVKISLYATLRKYSPDGKGNDFEMEFLKKSTVADLYKLLCIPDNVETVVLVNGGHVTSDSPISAGDKITLYPTITGG